MLSIILMLLAFCTSPYTSVTGQRAGYERRSVCRSQRKIDIAFVLDASGSVRYHFNRQKKLVKLLHNQLTENIRDVHMSASLFSDKAIYRCTFRFAKFFPFCVKRLKLIDKITRIDKGLIIARDEMFLIKHFHRPGALKVVIIVTDGDQTAGIKDAQSPIRLAKQLRERGVIVIILGVLGIDRWTLEKMDAGHGLLFYGGLLRPRNIQQLSTKVEKALCDVQWGKPKATCPHHVDIIFVVDSSGSLRGFFHAELYFVTSVAEAFEMDNAHSLVSVVRFSHTASTEINFNDYHDIWDFEQATKRIYYDGGRTRIDLGLLEAEREMMKDSHQARMSDSKVLKFVVVITDGQQKSEEPALIADRLRDQGIKVVVIGVGADVSKKDMQGIAGEGNKWYSYHNFDELIDPRTIRLLKNVTCTKY